MLIRSTRTRWTRRSLFVSENTIAYGKSEGVYVQNSEMFRQRVTHTGFNTLASSHPLFSFSPLSFFYVFFLFFPLLFLI